MWESLCKQALEGIDPEAPELVAPVVAGVTHRYLNSFLNTLPVALPATDALAYAAALDGLVVAHESQ